MLVDRCCDAIVLYSRFIPEEKLMEMINELPVPLVVMNRQLPKAPDRCIVFAQQEAAHAAVTHLLDGTPRYRLYHCTYAYAYRKGPFTGLPRCAG